MFRDIGAWIRSLQSDPLGTLLEMAFVIVALLMSLILHEIAHGYVALKCGDPTAKWMGRLSLDPRKHLDPIGTICMFFLGIGWAKPVPINPNNFKHRDRDIILVSFAGICMNLILFTLSTFFYVLLFRASGSFARYLMQFLMYLIVYNISLAVFNLLPVPPLDGYRLVNQIFFKGRLDMNQQTMRYIQFGFLLICLSGLLNNTLSTVCSYCMVHMANFFAGLLHLGFSFV